MPRFDYHSNIDHRLDNQIIEKKDLRFHMQDTAEDFAIKEYCTDFIPRNVLVQQEADHSFFFVRESPEPRGEFFKPDPHEVFYVNSVPQEG